MVTGSLPALLSRRQVIGQPRQESEDLHGDEDSTHCSTSRLGQVGPFLFFLVAGR